jgi:hypothetical protein
VLPVIDIFLIFWLDFYLLCACLCYYYYTYIKLKHVGKSMFIKTHCIMDCNSAKNGHCSPRLITLWIAQFVGALCAAASSTDTWPKGSPFLATKVSRLWGEGLRPGCGHLALGLSCPGVGAIPASWLPSQASGVCWQDPLMLGEASKPNYLGSGRKPQTQNKHSRAWP